MISVSDPIPVLVEIVLSVLINDLCDHLPVFVLMISKPLQKWKSKKYTKHDYSKFDSETFVTQVQETLNQLQIDQNKPSEALDLGILCLNRYLKEQAPVKQLTKSKKRLAHKPWITTGLLRSIKTKTICVELWYVLDSKTKTPMRNTRSIETK